MKRHLTSLLAGLIFGSVAGTASVSFAAEGKWTKKTDMPTPRFSLSASAVNGKIYAIGGWGQAGKLSTVEEYDPATETWTTKADMPTARKGIATCVMDGKIYAFGGAIVPGPGGDLLTTVEEYDPATDTWAKKKDMPSPRVGPSAVAVNGKIYVIGGWGPGAYSRAVDEYDPVTNTWQKKASLPQSVGNAGFAGVNGKIYVIGGGTEWIVLSTTWEYDSAEDQWTKKANMPTRRHLLSVGVLDEKLYAIGGDEDHQRPSVAVEMYDPETDTWTKKTKMLTARASLATAVVNGKIYAIGGHTGISWGNQGTVYPTVEEYTPAGWKPLAVSPQGKKNDVGGD